MIACSDLGDHDGALGLVVDAVEQRVEPVGDEEEAEGLVVGAVDRHPDVVQQRTAGDHDLGVALLHPVVADHRRLDPALGQQAQQPQRDVEDDLDVDPGVVRHAEPLRGELRHVPPGAHALVGVDGLEEALELAVAARGGVHVRLGDRLRRGALARVRALGVELGAASALVLRSSPSR